MKRHILQITAIVLILAAGMVLARLVRIPAPLISMVLFLVLLLTKVLKIEIFRGGISDLILANMAFFFLPPAVRVLGSLELLEGVVLRLLLVMTISNLLVMGVTGVVTQLFLKVEHSD